MTTETLIINTTDGVKLEYNVGDFFSPSLELIYVNQQADPYYDDSEEYVHISPQIAKEMIRILESYVLDCETYVRK